MTGTSEVLSASGMLLLRYQLLHLCYQSWSIQQGRIGKFGHVCLQHQAALLAGCSQNLMQHLQPPVKPTFHLLQPNGNLRAMLNRCNEASGLPLPVKCLFAQHLKRV